MGGVIRHADNRLSHRSPTEIPDGFPASMRSAAGGRAIHDTVGVSEDLVRILPVDEAITSVTAHHVIPDGPGGRASRTVVLKAAEKDVRVGRMLGDEVTAEASEPIILTDELALPFGIAVQENPAIAATPKLVRIVRCVTQVVNIRMGMRSDRGRLAYAVRTAACLNRAAPNRPAPRRRVHPVTAQIHEVWIGWVDGYCQIVGSLAARQDGRHIADALPRLAQSIEPIKALELPCACGDEGVEAVWIIRLSGECYAADIASRKTSARSPPRTATVIGIKNLGGGAALPPFRREEMGGAARRGRNDALPGRVLSHRNCPPGTGTRRKRPMVVAPTTLSRLAGSTASEKKASPARSGKLGSAIQLSPPSSLRITPTPRYAGSALTTRERKSWSVS